MKKIGKIRKKLKNEKIRKVEMGRKNQGKFISKIDQNEQKAKPQAPKTCLPLVSGAKSRGVGDSPKKFFEIFEKISVNRSTVQNSLGILDGRPIILKNQDFPATPIPAPKNKKPEEKRDRQKE